MGHQATSTCACILYIKYEARARFFENDLTNVFRECICTLLQNTCVTKTQNHSHTCYSTPASIKLKAEVSVRHISYGNIF